MKFNRRNVLIGLGSIAAGSGVLAGTGAFTSITATRDATVEVVGDANALLSIQAYDGPNGDAYVSTTSSGVALDLSTSGANGVNPDAVTQIDNVLKVMNQGTQPVGFWITDSSDAVTFHRDGSSVEGNDNAVVLDVGEQLVVDVEVDTTGSGISEGDQLLSSVTFHADHAESQTAPGQDGVLYVSKTANNADYRSIGAALSQVGSGETVLVDGGTYDEGGLSVGAQGVTLRAESGKTPTLDGGFGLQANDITVTGFTIQNGGSLASEVRGIYVAGTNGHRLVDNVLVGPGTGSGNPSGLEFQTNSNTTGVRVVNNEFRNWRQGVYQNATNEAHYEENTFDANAVGLAGLDTDSAATVTRNVFTNNSIEALGVFNQGDVTISQNDFAASNAAGVNNYGSNVVDARNNWWGAADGPSGGVSDADSSATANGSGVPLNTGSADGPINWDPYRSEPVFSRTITLNSDGGADYTDLANAFAALRPTDTLEIEPGSGYTATSPMNVPSGATVVGVGNSRPVITKQGTGVGGGDGVVQLTGPGTVENLEFDVGTTGTQPAAVKVLTGSLASGQQAVVRANHIERGAGGNPGISIEQQAAGAMVNIEDNTLYQAGAIHLVVETDIEATVTGNTVEEPATEGMFTYTHQADTGILTVKDNEVIAPGQTTSGTEEDIKFLEVPEKINDVDPQSQTDPAQATGQELESANPDADHVQVKDSDGSTYDT